MPQSSSPKSPRASSKKRVAKGQRKVTEKTLQALERASLEGKVIDLVSETTQIIPILKVKEEEKGVALDDFTDSQRHLMTFKTSETRIEGTH